jgi:hypothetical protein
MFENLNLKTNKTVILPAFLYGCELMSLASREEHRLRVLRGMFGHTRDEARSVGGNFVM